MGDRELFPPATPFSREDLDHAVATVRENDLTYKPQNLFLSKEDREFINYISSLKNDSGMGLEIPQYFLNRKTKHMGMKIEQIAEVCHMANKGYCTSIGDHSQRGWDGAPEWQKESAIKGVAFTLANPDATPADQHNSWMKEKLAGGWVYGEVKDPVLKTHPCMTAYQNLPEKQRVKDYIFRGIVNACREFLADH